MILDLNAQHASPDLCRRLWELGVDTGTAYVWYLHKGCWHLSRAGVLTRSTTYGVSTSQYDVYTMGEAAPLYESYPAYSVAELGELIALQRSYCPIVVEGGWRFVAHSGSESDVHPTEANARAALLIHILESENENAR